MFDASVQAQRLLQPLALKPYPRATGIERGLHNLMLYARRFRLRRLSETLHRDTLNSAIEISRAFSRQEVQQELTELRLQAIHVTAASGLVERALALSLTTLQQLHERDYPTSLALDARKVLLGGIPCIHSSEHRSLTLIIAGAAAGLLGLPVLVLCADSRRAKHLHESHAFLFSALNLRLGLVHELSPKDVRRKEYASGVVIATTGQAINDYLLDLLLDGGDHSLLQRQLEPLLKPAAARQRFMHGNPGVALLDQADLQLSDLALSPITVSGGDGHLWTGQALRVAHDLGLSAVRGEHYDVREGEPFIVLCESGSKMLETEARNLSGVWQSPRFREQMVTDVLISREMIQRGADYTVENERLVLKRGYAEPGLPQLTRERLQLIKLKEGLGKADDPEVLRRISIPGFLLRYAILGGVASAGVGLESLIWNNYGAIMLTPKGRTRTAFRESQAFIYASATERLTAVLERSETLIDEGATVYLPVYSREFFVTLKIELEKRLKVQDPDVLLPGAQVFGLPQCRGRVVLVPAVLVSSLEESDERPAVRWLMIVDEPPGIQSMERIKIELAVVSDGQCETHLCFEDPLIAGSLPHSLIRRLRDNLQMGKPLSGWAAGRILAYCLGKRQQILRRGLSDIKRMDLSYNKMLAFAGIGLSLGD